MSKPCFMTVPCSLKPQLSSDHISLVGTIVPYAHTISMAKALLHFLCLIPVLLVSRRLNEQFNKIHNKLASASLRGESIEVLMTSRNSRKCIIFVYFCRYRLLKPKPGDTGPTLGVLISTLRGLSSLI